MEFNVKVTVDLSDRTVEAISELANMLIGTRIVGIQEQTNSFKQEKLLTKTTDWTPAPEDEQDIKKATDKVKEAVADVVEVAKKTPTKDVKKVVEAAKTVSIKEEEAKPVPTDESDEAEDDDTIKLSDIRKLLFEKVNDHRESIAQKLHELGAKNVTKLDEEHYGIMYDFLDNLN